MQTYYSLKITKCFFANVGCEQNTWKYTQNRAFRSGWNNLHYVITNITVKFILT